MMEDELEELVEYAMEELRVLLKPDELKHYEELYAAFKKSPSSDEAKRAAYKIFERHLSETGMIVKQRGEE